jgi:hypothetical protein
VTFAGATIAAFVLIPLVIASAFTQHVNASAALSLSSTHESPAPAAQLATGWASNPGPGWYGGFQGLPGLGTGSERMSFSADAVGSLKHLEQPCHPHRESDTLYGFRIGFDTPGPVLLGVQVDYTENHKMFEQVYESSIGACQ